MSSYRKNNLNYFIFPRESHLTQPAQRDIMMADFEGEVPKMNRDFDGYTQLPAARVVLLAEMADMTISEVESFLYADWSNPDEHDDWLQVATNDELALWLRSCAR